MSAGREHAPKVAALAAYHEMRLSAAGRVRVERHLAGCEACRRTLAAMELYRRTAAQARASSPPALDWSRMEVALERHARAVAARQRAARGRRWMAALALAAAAALGLLWRGANPEPAPVAERGPSSTAPAPAAQPVEPAPVEAVATLLAGRASLRPPGSAEERALAVGDVLIEGAAFATAMQSEAHLVIGNEAGPIVAGLVVGASSALELARMREDEVQIVLQGGRVTSRVEPTTTRGMRFVVLAAEHRFVGRATHFELDLDAQGALTLQVGEGAVEVHRPDGGMDLVRAPGAWTSRRRAEASPELAVPHGLGAHVRTWPVLTIEHPEVVRWEVGTVRAEGAGTLAMRVAPGEARITGLDATGRAFRAVAVVGADGLALGADALVPEPPRLSRGTLPAEQIRDVVRRGSRRLQACWERQLRENADAAGDLDVRVTIAMDGTVSRTRIVGGDAPAPLQACVQSAVQRWTFPSPAGGPVTFDLPVRFRQQR